MMAPKLLATHSSHPQPPRLQNTPTIHIYRSVSGNGGSVAAASMLFPTHINVPFSHIHSVVELPFIWNLHSLRVRLVCGLCQHFFMEPLISSSWASSTRPIILERAIWRTHFYNQYKICIMLNDDICLDAFGRTYAYVLLKVRASRSIENPAW